MKCKILVAAFFLSFNLIAQEGHKNLLLGDKYYEQENFEIAEEQYRKANEDTKSLQSRHNLGNAIYEQQRWEEAITYYEEAAYSSGETNQKADAFYNLGNANIRQMELEAAIDAYKESLRKNPDDFEAKRNLYLAKLMQKEQQQEQQQQEQQQQQDQENQEQQEGEQQESENQEQQQGDNQEPSDQSGSGEESKEPQEGDEEAQAGEPQKLSKEDAAKLLQVIESEEKKVQEKLRKVSGKRAKPDKDW